MRIYIKKSLLFRQRKENEGWEKKSDNSFHLFYLSNFHLLTFMADDLCQKFESVQLESKV